MDYKSTKNYWDEIFNGVPVYRGENKINNGEIERCFNWLGENCDSVIDFGCGNGKALYRVSHYGTKKILGIDISEAGIKLAQKIQCEDIDRQFILGGVDELSNIESESFDGGILFNILDNISPSDCSDVIEQFYRILKIGGKLLIKLNPIYETSELDGDDEFSKIEDDFYLEESGVYFYNIDDNKMRKLLENKFEIIEEGEIEFKEFFTYNRVYLLEKCGE